VEERKRLTFFERRKYMERFCIDCRDYPKSDVKCSLALSADSKEELVEAAVQHGISVHGFKDTPEFREEIFKGLKMGAACSN
jgi:predicted small metal-binding protein